MISRPLVLAALAAALSGCAALDTHRVPGGPTGCTAVCEKWGMELAGMVQVGRDSDACVCAVKKEASSSLWHGAATAVAMAEELRQTEAPADLQGGAETKEEGGLLPTLRIPLTSSPERSETP
jgi:hypothetical protein